MSKAAAEKTPEKGSEKVKVKVTVEELEADSQPVVGSFIEGHPERLGSVGGLEGVQFHMYRHTGGRKRLLVAHDNFMEWQGSNYGSNAPKRSFSNYAVGVYNRATKRLRLMKVDNIFDLRQNIKGGFAASEDIGAEAAEDGTTGLERKQQLIEQFGASKAKRKSQSQQLNQVQASSISGLAGVQSSLVSGAERNKHILDEVVEKNIPPHNIDAKIPAEAYPLELLVPAHVLQAIDTKEMLLAAKKPSVVAEWREKQLYPEYVADRVSLIHSASTKEEKKAKARVLVLIGFLSHLRAARIRQINGRKELGQTMSWAPPQVIDFLCETFFTNTAGKLRLGDREGDLLVMYIIVLALHLEDFSAKLSPLRAHLGLTGVLMKKYCMELSCDVVADRTTSAEATPTGSNQLLCIKVPLDFPVPRKRKTKT